MPSRIILYAQLMRWAIEDNEPDLYAKYSRRAREFIKHRGYDTHDVQILLSGMLLGY